LFVDKNYRISCSGQIVITQSGHYPFELSSDDGSVLRIGGSVVISNDGNHAMTLRSGSRYLREGVHPFNLDYAQTGGGNFGLTLTSGGTIVSGDLFYR
jgi:hexosaminidase